MAQEQFAGPEYFTEFDPKAFAEKIKADAAKAAAEAAEDKEQQD
ncbi:hypothetical protein [Corynebacterium vitaeruminis]|uniref:Uncharacterized protein n=1 Tax=Corynebacterium vitaeruminis DSM 20294 TaxID=1224164 RepID=W5Y9N3_9CORY|nr:hypothetical protein [Corynebacterium vitaeruminis]AHI23238.1 hypothetical protein B843_09265 [Corynebacterium vitaeruminis DSM 20294]